MIKFYGETDMIYGYYLDKVKTKIINFNFEKKSNINVILEYLNIIKYYENIRVRKWLDLDSNFKSIKVIEYMRDQITEFIRCENKKIFFYYDQINREYLKDFWEIIEKNGLYKKISEKEFEEFLKNKSFLFYIFQFKKIVKQFSDILKKYIVSNYVNINYLRNILNITSNQLKITDKIKLLAKKRLQDETEKIFKNTDIPEKAIRVIWGEKQSHREYNGNFKYIYNLYWIKENLDYSTLLNNFIYLFEYVDLEMRLNLVSKKVDMGISQILFGNDGPSQYKFTPVFNHKNIKSLLEIMSYSDLLISFNIRLENIIEWFFKEYLFKEFNIENFITKMPGENLSYFEKCKVIIPEIDRILKQYNFYLEDREINQELVQISSTHLLFNNCKSINDKKYCYINSQKLENVAHFLYSDQSELLYVKGIDNEEMMFIDLLLNKNLKLEMFENFQIKYLKYLINEKILYEDKNKILRLVNVDLIYIIKEFYINEVLSYYHYSLNIRKELDKLLANNEIIVENKLFTKGEIDYLNYYLNKASFGNSLDLRNRYVHGTHSNDELEHKTNYYIFLRILIIIIIKINDDLCLSEISKESNNVIK